MTKKPLYQMVDTFTSYIESNKARLEYSAKLQNIFDGQLLPHLLDVLKSELSARAYERMVPRVVPINILTRIVNKLSKLYTMPVTREATSDSDQEIMDYAIQDNKLNTVFGTANKIYSMLKYFAVEPYFYEGEIKVRVLNPSQFLVYSDDDVTGEITVFLKYMASDDKNKTQLWFAYSDQEFIAFDTKGKIHTEYMQDNMGVNPYGEIPFVYCNAYSNKLMPTLDSDTLEMTLRIPQLLSDLNYSHKFQAHSMVYAVDLDPSTEIDGNPDGFTLFSSRDGDGKNGSIGFLKPQVEIANSINLVISELSLWLESKGIKAGSVGDASNALSGIAKVLDEADTSSARQEQVDVFSYMEDDFWKLYSLIHNHHLWEMDPELRVGMSEDPLKSIIFAEQKPLVDDKTVLENIKLKLDNKLTSKRRALSEANPDLDAEDIDELLIEIENENSISISNMVKPKEEENTEDMEDMEDMES